MTAGAPKFYPLTPPPSSLPSRINEELCATTMPSPTGALLDVASVLGDAIKYLKELLQKINDLNHELKETP
ncbi:Myc-type, basic helix-loop-helix (bHLH) domain-containing protein [Artemisia annua]|uniref:Myc-type, basic helix-loop-helix (BHLH) domain-containing protein n=1 Tax=Artemisia annua TaxID=35608 RepID=A0A2U1LRE7_ARTAN|nr:Myc-type, basic helix-loop-helix (bHLH) domain-containing protein [Artemisia annua]